MQNKWVRIKNTRKKETKMETNITKTFSKNSHRNK